MQDKRKFYINGQWIDPSTPSDLEVVNPSIDESFAVISLADTKDTNEAVEAAKKAFILWSKTSKDEKITLLKRLHEIYESRWDDMSKAISMEMGAPIDLASEQQTSTGSNHIKTFIKTLEKFEFENNYDEKSNNHIAYEPIGVCALITPWNWPINQITLKVTPALAAGCTMILKPSEIAPLSGMLFAEMIHEAGFPPGVFNLVNGDGAGVGTQLSGHPDVDMVSFTGSTRAGRLITKNSADTIKRVCLELGGKGANIVFSDADENAVRRGVSRVFNNSGQSCNAPTRMLVEKSIYERAVKEAIDQANKTKVDLASRKGNHIGPVVSKAQFDKIQNLIQSGIDEGATLVAGGPHRPDGLDKGYFVKPTIFTDVKTNMKIVNEEIFGPVISLLSFETEEEAISISNDTTYGLTNYIQTQDNDKAKRISKKLRSGMVEINGNAFSKGTPFGGYKQSGNGREGGTWGLEEYLEVKAISGWNL
ncbi:MAG: aldehyde dehydrogenase family protein [Pelagibacteraceae bacterium]|jgi:aldehyde dehydrogenase (NAD+)|nr:aldehyde dehydrogenase family protein [Pelagibacteraceae bacterium]MDP6784536.1 aldehyde dehydrogenase family protein [Alphaproteobacteria bacterium]MBO6467904.1 aldehyde dehydrogenase family protein [Pelagibacteraceae bacterium]MBO6470403.1 aldehyde dehydrogenase family protein [Pelagibacteraceae bacterium]MBO6471664.1 aldehyde dehydrogenase family protein [Pelagibacteraceae bacterium]|tara:strand:+ start:184 stop:1617 length:1434 start_codon:yes stop_codon:yes gene_type:complete